VDPGQAGSVKQVPEPLSPRYRSRIRKVSTRSRSHSGKHEPEFHTSTSSVVCPFRALMARIGPPFEQNNALTCGKTSQGIVEVAGIEPASSGFSMGLLRAQPALGCRDRRCYRRR
jgi:hypothetical protein